MHVNPNSRQDEQTLLREVLRIIAVTPDSRRSSELILQSAQSLTGANGGCFLLFDTPIIRVNTGSGASWRVPLDVLRTVALGLKEGISLNPPLLEDSGKRYPTVLAAPVYVGAELAGALFLLFRKSYRLTNAQLMLSALVDGVSIIAARWKAQIRQEREHQRILSAINSIADPLLVLDQSTRVILSNAAAHDVFPVAGARATGKPFREVADSDMLIAHVYEGKPLTEWETDDGRVFVPHIASVKNPDGSVDGWVLVLHDITRYKELYWNQNEFMRIVSHDLRSPLTSMYSFANFLETQHYGALNDQQMHCVEKIMSGVGQINAIVENIQDAGRFDPQTGFYEMSRSQCNLGDIVRRVVETHLVPAEKQELTIKVKADENLPVLNADTEMLERAVTNLVDNAIKYTPNGGKITVQVRLKDNHVIVSVRDTGFGISPENQKRLFERHVRIRRQEHKKIKGTGLGLFIVRSVAQRHGGNAWVKSSEGHGSTFYLSIPAEGANLAVAESGG